MSSGCEITSLEELSEPDRDGELVQSCGEPQSLSGPGHDLDLDRAYAVSNPHPTQLADVLLPEVRALPMIGRADELALLRLWLDAADPISLRCLVGRQGTGKTRLAIELCVLAEPLGWHAGFAAVTTLKAWADDATCRFDRTRPTLMVIDDADALASLLVRLPSRLFCSGPALRLLLLARDAGGSGGWRDELAGSAELDLARPILLPGLRSVEERRTLLAAAMRQGARAACAPSGLPPPDAVLECSEPMHLILAGLLAPNAGVGRMLARSVAELALLQADTELHRLADLAHRCHLDPRLVTHAAACVTLQDGCSIEAAIRLVEEECAWLGLQPAVAPEHVVDCLADALLSDAGDAIAPVRPMLIGGALSFRVLLREPPHRQAAILDRALGRSEGRAAAMLRRMADDFADLGPAETVGPWKELRPASA